MKLTPSELISTFRKKINSYTFFILFLFAAGITLLFLLNRDLPIVKGAVFGASLALFSTGFKLFERRTSLLKIMQPSRPDRVIIDLEKYLDDQHKAFRGTGTIRIAVGLIMMMAMLILIFYLPDSLWTGFIATQWLWLILFSMMTGWILMKDQMMLQDIKHSINNQPSEIS